MIASIRFWRAMLPHLPDTDAGNSLWAKIALGNERHGRKRHMPLALPLDPAEEALLWRIMVEPPTDYVAFVVRQHWDDALSQARPSSERIW
jgi:hypothetical protein